MVFKNFDELTSALPKGDARKTGVVVSAHDKTTLFATAHCRKTADLGFILVGDEAKIAEILETIGESKSDYQIINETDDAEASKISVSLVRDGKADFIVKGKLDTSVILKAVVNKTDGLYAGRLMSHLAFQKIPNYDKLIVLTDSGMVTLPTKEQLVEIIKNAVDALTAMGYENPMCAILSAAEKVNPKVPASVIAGEIAKMNSDGEITGCHIEGPVSYDILMCPEIAEKKGYSGKISGNADIMIVPDMAMGNVLGKALTITAGGKMAGIIVGAKAPIALTSRGSTDEEKINSILLAATCCTKEEK